MKPLKKRISILFESHHSWLAAQKTLILWRCMAKQLSDFTSVNTLLLSLWAQSVI